MITKCPVCNFDSDIFASFKKSIVCKCKKCGFGFTKNLNANFGNYHRDDTYIKEEKLFENIFLKRINKIQKFIKKGFALEVGCSTGLMLSLLEKRGWKVKGVEISEKGAMIAREKGINVLVKPFEEIKFREKFDLIVFNHTLEHLKDPFMSLYKSKKILKKNGFIYIDLPNFDSLTAKIFKRRWPFLLPKEHLWHFTEKSLRHLFQNLGFKIVYVEKSSGIWNFNDPYLELSESFLGLKKRFISNLLTLPSSFCLSKLSLGEDLMIIAKYE